MSDGTCLMNVMYFRRKSRTFDPTTVECCATVDLSAEDTQERVLAFAHDPVGDQKRVLAGTHDAVRDQSLPWRKDMMLNASRRRCVLHFVSPDQAGERLMRCHQYCGGAADFTSTVQWISRLCTGDGGSYFMRGLCVFLKRVTSESRLPRF